jgi:hypothetical protein
MHATTIIAYTYEAAMHCPACTLARIRALRPTLLVQYVGGETDEHGMPVSTTDREGNSVHPVFASDETQPGECCDDCGAVITEPADPFAGSFMQPEVYRGDYFSVNTSAGTEVVPCDVIGRTMDVHVEALLNYLEGTPDDPDETCAVQTGWLARMSAPGYLDCTDWTAHATEEAARAYLVDTYGNE